VRVWITRAEPGAAATAGRLRALGHEPLIAPLLEVRALADVRLDLTGVEALAFTSANAVAAFTALTTARDLPVFAVGEATAEAARAAGFVAVDSADGDVDALAARIAAAAPQGAVLYPSAVEPAGDLAGALSAAGVPVRAVRIYDTLAATTLPAAVEAAFSRQGFDAVLVHSPKAGQILAGLLDRARAAEIDAFALSKACAAPLEARGFRRLHVAPLPNEPAMLALLMTDARERPKKMLGPAYWAGLLFALACVVLGLVIGLWGPRLFPPPP
jgi:uroporphyrinogen-III synthase